jgi:hypothetical protein
MVHLRLIRRTVGTEPTTLNIPALNDINDPTLAETTYGSSKRLHEEEESMLAAEDSYDDSNGQSQDLNYFLEKVSKNKNKRGNGESSTAMVKREAEPKVKRLKFEST